MLNKKLKLPRELLKTPERKKKEGRKKKKRQKRKAAEEEARKKEEEALKKKAIAEAKAAYAKELQKKKDDGSILNEVYLQGNREGLASYHFLYPLTFKGDGGSYISYEAAPKGWRLNNGDKMPA